LDLRKRALRKGIWFSSLTLADRILAEMIGKYLKIVRNATLATVIARILGKLVCALRNSFMDTIESIGKPVVAAVAMKAYSFGNKQALEWPQDLNYVRYLGMMADPSRGNDDPGNKVRYHIKIACICQRKLLP
jgi:hypothetical protein